VKKRAGILMPVASLPSPWGIGDFGKYSYQFVDFLAECGVRVWQILPLNPLSYGNSPYQPYSSMAGDELYIDLEDLKRQGLLGDLPARPLCRSEQIDYGEARRFKGEKLREAFACFEPDEAYEEFIRMDWVYPYAVFLTFKKHNGMICWTGWPKAQRDWPSGSGFDESVWAEDIAYEMFVQYTFYRQWMALKEYANGKGIELMGDIPFYVGLDSQDVWTHREDFLLGADGAPAFIAGVPPDYFSATGQRWGNPIYNWDNMEKKGFVFWKKRISYTACLFDIVRIDHFRAFDTYWKIPASCPTAMEGQWVEAPGYALFDQLYEEYPDLNIVAEDLGEMRPEVYVLRDHYGLPGMDVIQFNFEPEEGDTHEGERLVSYTGTHDNETVLQWFQAKPKKEQELCRAFLRKEGIDTRHIAHAFVTYTMRRPTELAVVPVSDLLGLGEDGRINTPGTIGAPNWMWRLADFKRLRSQRLFLRNVIAQSGRDL
jgi:4-alpha-glucanotransferase